MFCIKSWERLGVANVVSSESHSIYLQCDAITRTTQARQHTMETCRCNNLCDIICIPPPAPPALQKPSPWRRFEATAHCFECSCSAYGLLNLKGRTKGLQRPCANENIKARRRSWVAVGRCGRKQGLMTALAFPKSIHNT